MAIIAIKTSQTANTPASLSNSELAYSYISNKLFIGQTNTASDSVTVEYIGGKLLVDKVANLESQLFNQVANITAIANTQYFQTNGVFRVTTGTGATYDTVLGSLNPTANTIQLGVDNEDPILTDGALTEFDSGTTVYNAIDSLNECMYNVHKGTFVRSVDFSADQTSVGVGTEITLTSNAVGNANRFNINWGDGSWTNNHSSNTSTHTYSTNENSPYTVSVYAYNTNGSGSGSNTSLRKIDYINIYTADPVVHFDLYDQLTGGSALSTLEANTGQAIYFENNTTNIGNNSTTATFSVNWGDGNLEQITGKTEDGGSQGARLAHTYTLSSGSSRFLIAANVKSTSTATPEIFPISNTDYIKVFDTSIAAPDNLTNKTISWATSSSGSSPALAVGFTENSSGKSAGDSTSSSFPRITSGSIASSSMSSFFHTTGSVTQQVNDTTAGSPTVDSSGVDFYNYDSDGTDVLANERIYAQGLYETGTKARINYNAAGGSVGVNKVELVSDEGNSNELFYVYDDVTTTPTVDVSSATVSHGSGSYNYISGIPYYNSGDTITLSGVTVSNLTGQTYYNGNPITIGDTNVETGSGTSISDQSYSYTTALSSGDRSSNIPNADLSPTIEDLTVNIGSGDNAVKMFVRAQNVNGNDTETINSPIINVYNGTDVIDESSISVSDSLGSGYTTDGVRISGLTGATPSLSNTTDYYTDNSWTAAETVAGTDEAIIRYGSLTHNAVDYSSGYLPVGPDLATGRSGSQYFRFAFKRNSVSTIRVRLTGTVSGFYIAAPGTSIDDASTLNGWLDASVQYAGAGVPGADTGNGGNGSNGCAFTGADKILDGTSYNNQTFDLTLGTESSTNAYESQVLISVVLNSGDSLTSLSVEAAT